MTDYKIKFRFHAIQRMFERDITVETVKKVIFSGKVIKDYSDDKPYPSQLILGFDGNSPLHVVVAINDAEKELIVITVYSPQTELWDASFERKK